MTSQQGLVLAQTQHLIRNVGYLAVSVLVIDRSGSMEKFNDAPQVQANRFLEELAKDSNASVTAVGVVTFADDFTFDVPFELAPKALRLRSYRAGGNTLLYQTVYECLGALMLLVNGRGNSGGQTDVLVTVLTDGRDTHSHPSTLPQLRALSAEGRKRGWQLRVFGFGVDGSEIAQNIGFIDGVQDPNDTRCGGFRVEATERDFEKSVTFSVTSTCGTTRTGR